MLRAGLAALMLAGFASDVAAEAPALMMLRFGAEELRVEAEDILTAEIASGGFGGESLNVKLEPALNPALAALSKAHLGEKVGFYICGQLMVEPILQVPLTEANFVLALTDAAEAAALARILREGHCPGAAGN